MLVDLDVLSRTKRTPLKLTVLHPQGHKQDATSMGSNFQSRRGGGGVKGRILLGTCNNLPIIERGHRITMSLTLSTTSISLSPLTEFVGLFFVLDFVESGNLILLGNAENVHSVGDRKSIPKLSIAHSSGEGPSWISENSFN